MLAYKFYKLRIQYNLYFQYDLNIIRINIVGSVVEWLQHRTDDQHGLGSKPTCAILLCPWERHFTAFSPAWWSTRSSKLLADSNILASPEAGRGNCLPYV